MNAEHVYDTDSGTLLAVILRQWQAEPGIRFFTRPEHALQLGVMRRPAGYRVHEHYHAELPRTVLRTAEVLVVKRGRVRLTVCGVESDDTMSHQKATCELAGGDIVLLLAGWHSLDFLEETEIVEVKNGPWVGDGDKRRLNSTVGEKP